MYVKVIRYYMFVKCYYVIIIFGNKDFIREVEFVFGFEWSVEVGLIVLCIRYDR